MGPDTLQKEVVAAMRKLFPEELADSAWDNTGLLLGQAPLPPSALKTDPPTVLLTNDLTAGVVGEAIREGAHMIVCYHPVIFRPLKSLTTADPMQRQLLRLVANGIGVYCPHTAMDAAVGGLNDWLCDIVLAGDPQVERTVAQPITKPLPDGHQGSGYGRTVQLRSPISLPTLLRRVSAGVGGQRYLMVALPPLLRGRSKTKNIGDGFEATENISTVAVCAGSGADVLKNTNVDVLVTGEMAHHYALSHTERGQIVVTVFHSNSERKYLEQRLTPLLEAELNKSGRVQNPARVLVSRADHDPFEIVDVESLA
ncbi:NGG1p interacting factor 3 [Xylariaceae sp. FL0804]|nr:NGG1p interacting factor 3 [Xylariaceae sp. FL0804]